MTIQSSGVSYSPSNLLCSILYVGKQSNPLDINEIAPPMWDAVISVASLHGLTPNLYWTVRQRADQIVPRKVFERLETAFTQNKWRNLQLSGELVKIASLLKSSGISMLAIKGPVLAECIYGNIALRRFIDLDVLIHAKDLGEVTSLLIDQGYQRSPVQRQRYDVNFVQLEKKIRLEVHWDVTHRHLHGLFNTKLLWRRAHSVSFQGSQLDTPSLEDTLLYLCDHGYKDHWARLSWVLDIAQLVTHTSALDWAYISKTANEFGLRRVLLLGLAMAQYYFGCTLPSHIQDEIDHSDIIPIITTLFSFDHHILGYKGLTLIQKIMFHLRMRHRYRDHIAYLLPASRLLISSVTGRFVSTEDRYDL